MQTARAWFTACVFDDKIYAFGGVGSGWGSPCMKTVEVYDPVANTWEPKNDLPYGIQNAPAVVIDSMIYLFGGALTPGGPPVDTVLQYDPILDTTTIFTQLPSPAKIGAPSELNGKIYIVGGFTNSWPYNPDSTVLVYTPPTTGIEGPSGSGYRPQGFALQQNYPNPSNPATTIEFFIPRPEFVTLKVYN
ncbi:MAG: hypothetical protein GWN00_19435, partial [Aliifodinibius sp.]|nr:hypothetical protein [Fodinibius sp.]NIV13237.1 hypothetical protein [Fodinibius sp.]NIY26898.1 hypothetical protein [Fodinibius sp.]